MLRVVEAFSGIGSQAKALKRAGIEHEILATVEWDINAIYAYDLIHNGTQDHSNYETVTKPQIITELSRYTLSNDGKKPLTNNYLRMMSRDALLSVLVAIQRSKNLINITEVSGENLPEEIDLLTYSFPCQDLSICGLWHGNVSGIKKGVVNRSGMLWEIERLLHELKVEKKSLPKFLLMENVNNIISKRHEPDFNVWKDYLKNLGYSNYVFTLNALNFGIPQNRKRTFMISVLKNNSLTEEYLDKFFEENNLEGKSRKAKPLSDFLKVEFTKEVYQLEAFQSNPNDTPSRRKIHKENLLIFDKHEYKSSFVNTITTKQDRNPNSGVIGFDLHGSRAKYRNLTPRECFLLMGFDESDFDQLIQNNVNIKKNTPIFAQQKLIKLAGNSIVVNVLEEIFLLINEINEYYNNHCS